MRKPRKAAGGRKPGSAAAPAAPLPNPYVVRYGPWARNLYPGLPPAVAFGLIAQVANMPTWLFLAWDMMVAILVLFCVFVRDARFYRDGTVMVRICFLAVIPVLCAGILEVRCCSSSSSLRTIVTPRRLSG